MKSWGKAILFGFFVWLIPFVVSFIIFPLHETFRPLFESIMAVTVTLGATIFGLLYMKPVGRGFIREGVTLGIIWVMMSILIDAPLMLFGGPMHMSFSEYLADIGVTYIIIPIVTIGLSIAETQGTALIRQE